jgi:NADPH-dependent ferric siderophore reductase
MSVKGRLLGALGPLVLREARVVAVESLSASLRRVRVAGESLRGAPWRPGDKVQVVIGADVRTYTPTAWAGDTTSFLVFAHGAGPGAAFGRAVSVGDRVRFVGPQRSVRVDGPVVLFGDETAFGLAEALDARGVFEVSDRDAAAAFAAFRPSVMIPVDGDRHYDAVAEALVAASGGATVVLAGRARSIQEVRRRLAARGRAAPKHVKAYWADGKAGLD